MKIKGPSKLVDMVEFCASCLKISNFYADVRYAEENESSMCITNADGSFDLVIQTELDEEGTLRHVGHEMVHLKQFKHDELRQINDAQVLWRDTVYDMHETDEDEYWLSPWEMEARALEDWFVFRWESK